MTDLLANSITAIHCIPNLKKSSGGPPGTAIGVAKCTSDLGVKAIIFAAEYSKAGDENVAIEHDKVDVVYVPAWYVRQLRVAISPTFGARLQARAAQCHANIFVDHGIWTPQNRAAAGVAKSLRIPRIVVPHGMLSPWCLAHKVIKKRAAWMLYQRKDLANASAFRAASSEEAAHIRTLGFRQPIAVIPNGVEIPPPINRLVKREAGAQTALFIGRIHPVKGLINLVSAWNRLRPVGWTLVIAGPDEENHLEQVSNDILMAGLQKTIRYVGPVSGAEKEELFRNADLFVLPSLSENFGNVVTEALAHSIPVIATRATPWRRLQDHRCGWWVDGEEESLVEALREATSMPTQDREEMGRRGRSVANRLFSWERVGEAWLLFYRWIIEGGVRPHFVDT